MELIIHIENILWDKFYFKSHKALEAQPATLGNQIIDRSQYIRYTNHKIPYGIILPI